MMQLAKGCVEFRKYLNDLINEGVIMEAMMKRTLGMMIAELRKEQGMTQLELAEKMGVTDKAVSKWERDLSCPDINSLPNLAAVLDVSVDELMQTKKETSAPKKDPRAIIDIACKAIALAMGIAVITLSVLNELTVEDGIVMLGVGLVGISVSALNNKEHGTDTK